MSSAVQKPPSNKHSAAVTEPNTGRSVVNLDRDVGPSFSQDAERQAGRSGMKTAPAAPGCEGVLAARYWPEASRPSVVSASHSLTAASASSRSAPLARAYRYTASCASADVASSAMAWRAATHDLVETSGAASFAASTALTARLNDVYLGNSANTNSAITGVACDAPASLWQAECAAYRIRGEGKPHVRHERREFNRAARRRGSSRPTLQAAVPANLLVRARASRRRRLSRPALQPL